MPPGVNLVAGGTGLGGYPYMSSIIHEVPPKCKTPTPDNAPARFADMRRFLAIAPIPRELRHLTPHIKKLPLQPFLDLVINSAAFGFNDDKIADGIIGLADFSEAKAHRCACCLGWVEEGFYPFASIIYDHYEFFVVCAGYKEKVMAEQATGEMQRNLRAYTGLEG
jgi:hypothetical protein